MGRRSSFTGEQTNPLDHSRHSDPDLIFFPSLSSSLPHFFTPSAQQASVEQAPSSPLHPSSASYPHPHLSPWNQRTTPRLLALSQTRSLWSLWLLSSTTAGSSAT